MESYIQSWEKSGGGEKHALWRKMVLCGLAKSLMAIPWQSSKMWKPSENRKWIIYAVWPWQTEKQLQDCNKTDMRKSFLMIKKYGGYCLRSGILKKKQTKTTTRYNWSCLGAVQWTTGLPTVLPSWTYVSTLFKQDEILCLLLLSCSRVDMRRNKQMISPLSVSQLK